jgi:hypothetical protein
MPTTPFRNIHQLLNPKSGGRVAPTPQFHSSTASAPPVGIPLAAEQDLLGMVSPTSSAPPSTGGNAVPRTTGETAHDLIGMFGKVAVSSETSTAPASGPGYDPFAPTPPIVTPIHPANAPQQTLTSTPSSHQQQQQPRPYQGGQSPFGYPPPAQAYGTATPSAYSSGAAPTPHQQPVTCGSPQGAPSPQHQQPHHDQRLYYRQQPPSGQYLESGHTPPAQALPGQPGVYGMPPQQQPPMHQPFQTQLGYPPQQYASQQQTPTQPPKPNISQFDPFK